MPAFSYAARDSAANVRKGVEDAASPAALAGKLRDRGWLVINVQPYKPGQGLSFNPYPWLWLLAGLILAVFQGRLFGSKDDSVSILVLVIGLVVIFSSAVAMILPHLGPRSVDVELSFLQLAIMIRSGLTLLGALRTLSEQANRASMRLIWETIANAIQGGGGLADSMIGHRCFSSMTVQLIRVGEQTGTLEPVVTRAADSMERRRQLRTTVVSAMAYPAIVFVAAIGVAAFMVLSVIPKIEVVLSRLGRKLPAITQALLDVSNFAQEYLPAILGTILGLTLCFVLLYLTPRGRLFFDRRSLTVPLIGYLLRLSATVQFSYALGTLVRSGVTLTEALGTVSGVHSNRYAAGVVAGAKDAVNRGGSLSDQLNDQRVYLPMLPKMVAVGETSGTLDEVLDEVARFHENQLQVAIRRLSLLIEPVVVVLVGGMVGFVYIAFFMALFAVTGSSK